jgi:hypothetical protein
MGSGSWDPTVYTTHQTFLRQTGQSAFQYSDSGASHVHADLDPKGVGIRESRDNDEHPESLAIAIFFDETGSMGSVPRVMQKKLTELFGLLLRKGYVADPQIMFGAVGDSYTDDSPLQVSQFESDNRMDDWLSKIFLEGNGGGQMHEGYEMVAYFLARHTALDCWEKRGRKGYAFIIADEKTYNLDPANVRKLIGDELNEGMTAKQIFDELAKTYNVYIIQPKGSSYWGMTEVTDHWKEIVGSEHVIQLEDPDAVCETIALTIGLNEGTIDLAQGIDDLKSVGSTAGGVVSKALAPLGMAKGGVVKTPVPAGLTATPDSVARI